MGRALRSLPSCRKRRPNLERYVAVRRAGLPSRLGAAAAREVRGLGGRGGGGLVLEQAQAAGRQPRQGRRGTAGLLPGRLRRAGRHARRGDPGPRRRSRTSTPVNRLRVAAGRVTGAAAGVIATPALPNRRRSGGAARGRRVRPAAAPHPLSGQRLRRAGARPESVGPLLAERHPRSGLDSHTLLNSAGGPSMRGAHGRRTSPGYSPTTSRTSSASISPGSS